MFKALSSLRLLPLLAIAACAPALPGARGARPVAARPDTLWVPGREAPPRLAAAELALPPDLVARREALTLEDVVALALEGNPEVRAAWATARSRAAAYGAARAGWFPTISGEASATRLQTSATQGRSAVEQTVYEPSVSFTWLLLDAGGAAGPSRRRGKGWWRRTGPTTPPCRRWWRGPRGPSSSMPRPRRC
ncbi:MAG: TolC family protein [Gemmatimonadetes bacterium]|nr:TolC family protein [Gemmatimonadota bacterium]